MNYHLAQINIARLIAPLDDPKIAEFVAQLEPINALADKAPGFVWRLQSESGNATDIAYSDDPFVIVNMSVWESVEALREFAYNSNHIKVFRDREIHDRLRGNRHRHGIHGRRGSLHAQTRRGRENPGLRRLVRESSGGRRNLGHRSRAGYKISARSSHGTMGPLR